MGEDAIDDFLLSSSMGQYEGLLPRLFGLRSCDRLLISTLVHFR